MDRSRGAAVAIQAAADALIYRDWIAPEAFAAVYQYVEPEIPFASLSAPARPIP